MHDVADGGRLTTATFVAALERAVADGLACLHPVHAVIAGTMPRKALTALAVRYYGEVRALIDVRLPERLRLAPYDAPGARRLFHDAYHAEHGRFRPGTDHPSLFARVCTALGVTPGQLAEAARVRCAQLSYLRRIEPSHEALTRELAVTYAWESVAPHVGGELAGALERHYGIPPAALQFFILHADVDATHAREALRALVEAATNDALRGIAQRAARAALAVDGPW